MRIISLLRKFGRDVMYLCIIGGLVVWTLMGEKRQEVWNKMNKHEIRLAEMVITNHNDNQIMYDIRRKADENGSAQNEDYYQRAKHAQNQTLELLSQKIGKIRSNIAPIQDMPAQRCMTDLEIQSIKNTALELAGTFAELVDYDQIAVNYINTALQDESYWRACETLCKDQTDAFIGRTQFRIALALETVLSYCQTKVGPGIICNWGLMPSISTQNAVILPGQMYEAEIFTAMYSTIADGAIYKVNGKELPTKAGVAFFSQRYNSPGEHKYEVEIVFTDKSNQMHHYSKEFSLMVIDSCR